MNKKDKKILEKMHKHFCKISTKKITYYDRKKNKLGNWDYFYIRKWNKVSIWDKFQENLISKPLTADEYKGADLKSITIMTRKIKNKRQIFINPRKGDLNKIFIRASKLKYRFRTKDRKVHKVVFIATTKDEIKNFRELKKHRQLPLLKRRGKILPVIDLSEKTKPTEIIEVRKLGESP